MGLKAHSLTSIASESREHFGRRLSFFFQNGIFHPSREDFSLIRLNSRAKVSVQAESSVGVRRLPATEPYAHAANAGRRLSPSAAPASSQTGTTFSVPDATSRTRTAQPLIGSRMTTVWLACAAMTPGAISNRSGVSGSRLETRDLPVSAVMEREKITWSHHGGRIRGTDDGCTIARESNAAITKSCTNQGSTAVLVDDGLSHHERRKVSF
jgi:hypothetical protein